MVSPWRRSGVAAATGLWLVLLASALVAGAWWLRSPEIRYLLVCALATALAGVAVGRSAATARRWALPAVSVGAVFVAIALVSQREIMRIDRDWEGYRAAAVDRGLRLMSESVEHELVRLRSLANQALASTESAEAPEVAFRALEGLAPNAGTGLVVLTSGAPTVWAGRIQAAPSLMVDDAGVAFTPFHVVLFAAETGSDGRRAIATRLLQALPPADRFAPGLEERVARRAGLSGFRFDAAATAMANAGAVIVAGQGAALAGVTAVPPSREEARLRTVEGARSLGVMALAATLLLLLLGSWRVRSTLPWRLIPLATALVMIALVPLSAFSRVTVIFDPTVYFADFGGAFTANVGALMLAGAITLLAVLLILRRPMPLLSRARASLLVGAIIAGGPFLLRLLSRGVSPPPGGITAGLWLAWELALFLAAATLLVVVAAFSPALRRTGRGLHPLVAPALAAVAALAGPPAMQATGGWPVWYAGIWIVAIGALAVTRRHPWVIITAALVASLGAATVTWNAGVRGRMALAARDVALLEVVEPFLGSVLDRLGDELDDDPPPHSQADLLRAYVRSDLEGTGFPVQLTSWSPEGMPVADLPLSFLDVPETEMIELARASRERMERIIVQLRGVAGAHVGLAVPYADGTVLTVVVGPRTRLIGEAPFNVLLGLEPRERGTPPYALTLMEEPPIDAGASSGMEWYRADGELHGVSVVPTQLGPARAHVEIELRTLDVLVQRGTLVVLSNIVLILLLWVVSTLPGGGLRRWLRRRLRSWHQSYRARLTIALFAFFVIPAAAFAAWSYQRLQSEDRQSRELLVREMLRALAMGDQSQAAQAIGVQRDTPIWLYRGGELWQTSLPLLQQLAPTGRFLPADVYLSLTEAREVFASRMVGVGGVPMLFGYRVVGDRATQPVVLSVPARGNEEALEQRRRDLGILVLFATVLGAFGALWLSGIAARSLAEPIGSLRRAALAIAAGEREPPLAGVPPLEFRPVFSAFRRMASDLGESRAALEAAQRRTAAVLRNVASGVVAVNGDGQVVLANPRAESLLEQPLPPECPLPAVGGVQLAELARAFLADGTTEEEELDMPSGERQIHIRLTRLSGSRGAVITLDDVTELARAQRVLAWGEMARQVAHEIKNPLTPIRLGVQHLKRAHGDAHPHFEHILDQNVSRILAEIDRLDEIARSFSRYGAPPAERLTPESTDVAAVARDVVELERLDAEGVEWRLVGADSAVLALARADELREVLLNILENARHAHATVVELRLHAADGRVAIEVRDDGRGIPAPILPRIFEPHFSTRTSGSGLGLAVSRQLVESWGGTILITSNGGTLVRVELAAAE